MSKSSKIAVVILNWNGEKLLERFLPSVIANSASDNIEIIVADNCSDDLSIDLIKQNYPSVKTLKLEKNFGFAKGYNQALKEIDANYYILLNSDVEVSQNWIEPCLERFKNDESIAVIQPKILSYANKNKFEYAGAAGGFIDKYGYPFCRGRILNKLETDLDQYNQSTPIFWASGACMFIRAEAYHKAGGFDADFWAHMEEIDLCWRLKNSGLKVIYEPQSVVYHVGGGTLSYASPKKVYLNFRNNLWMLFKNLPKEKFKRIMIIRMILDGVAAAKFLVGLQFRNFTAVVNAHIAFYKNFRKLRRKRTEIQKEVVVRDHNEIYTKSIMWKFFLQRTFKFSELNFKP